jgi:hypothetical protein
MMSTHKTSGSAAAVADGSRRRARTERSVRAAGVAAELRNYFRSATQLALALGTSRDTVRAWSAARTPARPRVELLDAAELLLVLCRAARRYVADDLHVGDWVNAPDPRLRGASPAQALRRDGREGLEELLAGLALVAPPRPEGPVDLPSLEDLRTALVHGIGTEAARRIERIASAGPVELSDARLDAELASVAGEEESAGNDRRDAEIRWNARSPSQTPLVQPAAAGGG